MLRAGAGVTGAADDAARALATARLQMQLEARLGAFGERHLLVADTLENLAGVAGAAAATGAEALAALQRAVRIRSDVAPGSPGLARACELLGRRCVALGRFDEGEAAFARSVELYSRVLGPAAEEVLVARR